MKAKFKTVIMIILFVTTLLTSFGFIKTYNTNKDLKKQIEILQQENDRLTDENEKLNDSFGNIPETDKYIIETKHAIITYFAELPNDMTDGTTTASGKHVEQGMIGAPKEYAFGTKMIIDGVTYTVEDRGGYINTLNNGDIRLNIFVPRNENETDEDYKQRVLAMGVTESEVQIVIGEKETTDKQPIANEDIDEITSKVASQYTINQEDYFEFSEDAILDDIEYDYNNGEVATITENTVENDNVVVENNEIAAENDNVVVENSEIAVENVTNNDGEVYIDDSETEIYEETDLIEQEESNKAVRYLKYIIVAILIIVVIIFLTTSGKPQDPEDPNGEEFSITNADSKVQNNGKQPNNNKKSNGNNKKIKNEYEDNAVDGYYKEECYVNNQNPELEINNMLQNEVVDNDSNVLIDDEYYDRVNDAINKTINGLIDDGTIVNDIGIEDDFNVDTTNFDFDFETQEYIFKNNVG